MKRLALLCLFVAACGTAIAEDTKEVLIDRLPRGVEPAMVIDLIKNAFTHQEWTVTAVDATSVSATIDRPPVHAHMRISIYGQALVYEGAARRRAASGPQGGVLIYDRPVHATWVRALKNEIGLKLATIPDR